MHVCLFLTPNVRKTTVKFVWYSTTKLDISLAFFVRFRKNRPLSSMSSLHGIFLAKITTSINCGYRPGKAIDSRAIAGFWNLSCSPVGAEVFSNKKKESDFSTMLDCLYLFGVFARHLHLLLEVKGKSVLRPFLPYFSA